MTARDAVLDCFLAHPGQALTIAHVERWVATHADRTWKDIGTTLADLVVDGNNSSQYRNGRWFLERVEDGVYRMAVKPGPASATANGQLASSEALSPSRSVRCWAVITNDKVYDLERAARAVREDTWTVPSGNPQPGDRLVFWKSKGGTGRRGVVALGEALSSPAVMEHNPATVQLWGVEPGGPQRRIWTRYIVPPGAPLWLEDDATGVLASLSVSRGQGSALFYVTADQWDDLVELLGGLPDSGDSIQDAAADAAVAALDADACRRQGFMSSTECRKVIEAHAMAAAEAHFTVLGYSMKNTSATCPYDFVGTKGANTIFVEVKGTTTEGEQVILTRNEVEHARAHREQMALFILAEIQVEEQPGGPVASGGGQVIYWPWDVDGGELEPLSYMHRLLRA